MTYTESLFAGVWEQLDPIGVPIILGVLPQAGDAIAVNFYGVQDHGTMTDTIQGIQLTIRADSTDSRATSRLADQAHDLLHGLTQADWGGVPIVHVYLNSQAYLGVDDSKRHKITQNYYAQLSRAGLHRTDT